jgi:hypothetical protein
VPDIKELKDKIFREGHESTYSIHPRGNKMYHDLKVAYWWYSMRRDIAEYVSYPVPRNRERSLHTCAQDVQITRMATI